LGSSISNENKFLTHSAGEKGGKNDNLHFGLKQLY
jgi:hypothetical protein